MKLNVGCGDDYRPGYINIDGSDDLPKVDRVIDITQQSLLDHFDRGQVDHIIARDIVEHHFHWEGVQLMTDFYELLKPGGVVDIRVPDTEWILRSNWSTDQKIKYLYGGQDIPYGNPAMDKSRKQFPQYFCHKYGWTMAMMKKDLIQIGFSSIVCKQAGANFECKAVK